MNKNNTRSTTGHKRRLGGDQYGWPSLRCATVSRDMWGAGCGRAEGWEPRDPYWAVSEGTQIGFKAQELKVPDLR